MYRQHEAPFRRPQPDPAIIALRDEAILEDLRSLARQLESEAWQWIGPHMSQRHFGITETRAKELAARHGGTASKMP